MRWPPIFERADKVEDRGRGLALRRRSMGGKPGGSWAAFTFANFPLAHLRFLYEAANHAVAPKQSSTESTPRGHVG